MSSRNAPYSKREGGALRDDCLPILDWIWLLVIFMVFHFLLS